MNRIMTAPISQEMTDAGPACSAAARAPNNQPEPMIEPTDANNRPIRPIWRFSRSACTAIPLFEVMDMKTSRELIEQPVTPKRGHVFKKAPDNAGTGYHQTRP